jgi:PKD repeat protein
MKKLLLLVGLLTGAGALAQTANLGKPVAFSGKFAPVNQLPQVVMPGFDLQLALFEDSLNTINVTGPYRFGYEHSTSIDMLTQGLWETMPSGSKICRIVLKAPDAYTMNIQFHNFYLPEGTRLDMYTADMGYHHGSYTSANNNPARMLGSDLIPGESMVVEYYEPAGISGTPALNIGLVVHGYRDIFEFTEYGGARVNESGNCNMDVICPDGAPWATHKQAVARILVGGGLCTGSLVNNTANDGTPYFLTANHCGPQSMGAAVFRFNYESPTCGTGGNSVDPGAPYDNVNGSVLRARRTNSDFGLIELNSVPPAAYQVYYAGWDRSGSAVPNCTGIHHPSGDVKKISFDDDPLTITSYGATAVPGDGTHWRIETWERNTTTEGGSSGSAIFDQNGRIIGQLHGGGAACGNTQSDWYGAFHVSWDGTNSSQRLRDWLDPSNTVQTLDGYDPNAPSNPDDAGITAISDPTGNICGTSFIPSVTLRNYGANTLTSVTIQYNVDGGTNQNFSWTGSLGTGLSTTVTLPSMTTTNGAHTFNATTTLPNGNVDGNSANDNANSAFSLLLNGQIIDFTLDPDCWGSEITWQVRQGAAVLYSGSGSADATPNGSTTTTDSWCLDVGCYDFVITDSYGDGMYGSQYGSCNVDGTYLIEDATGTTLATILAANSDFGTTETNNFCVTATALGANFTQSTTTVCAGSTVSFSDVSTGSPVSWSWSFPGGTPSSSTQQNPTVTYNAPGTYNVSLTVTDASSGTDSYTSTGAVVVVGNPSISITGSNVTCNGACNGSATSTVTGGTAPYTISWSNGGSGTAISALCPNTYSASVADANGCSASSNTVTVTQPAALSASSSTTQATCGTSNGTATVTVTGGTSGYTYSLNAGAPQGSGSFSGLAVGNYTVDITDANGCTTSTSFSITNPNAPTATVSPMAALCNGDCNGQAAASVSGGTTPYTYLWSNGATTATASNLCAGSYTVTVTDAAGCQTTSNATVSQPATLAVTGSGTDELNGNDGTVSITTTGGTTGYTYSWTGPNGFTSTSEDLTGLAAGTYSVTVTDANGCSETFQTTISSQVGVDEVNGGRNIVVYPNPNTGDFFIYLGEQFNEEVVINIYAADGRLVHHASGTIRGAYHVSLELSSGVYITEVNDASGRVLQRVVIK